MREEVISILSGAGKKLNEYSNICKVILDVEPELRQQLSQK